MPTPNAWATMPLISFMDSSWPIFLPPLLVLMVTLFDFFALVVVAGFSLVKMARTGDRCWTRAMEERGVVREVLVAANMLARARGSTWR